MRRGDIIRRILGADACGAAAVRPASATFERCRKELSMISRRNVFVVVALALSLTAATLPAAGPKTSACRPNVCSGSAR